jgi:anti-anti-sigma factor
MTKGLHIIARDGVVTLFGELDILSRDEFASACHSCSGDDVVVDLSGLTYLDCSGYRAFIETRDRMSWGGRELSLRHAVGEPARLLNLLSANPANPATAAQSGR